MFLGHFGLAFAAKRWGPGVSLAILIVATQWADLLWPVLVLAGVERVSIEPGITAVSPLEFLHYPWTHSLALAVGWGLVFAGLYYAWRRRAVEAALVGSLVPSHWLLDVVVHTPDLPVWPGGPTVGLGLWNSLPATLVVEFGLLAVGLRLYLDSTTGTNPVGRWGPHALAFLLGLVYLGLTFGPAPADSTSVAVGALALWTVVPLAHWLDSHRRGEESKGP